MSTARPPVGRVHGIWTNRRQFFLLVLINAFVGAMVGIERTNLPLLAESEFGIASATATLSFLIAFGVTKALSNFLAGHAVERVGRKPVLVAGWVAGLPVPLIVIWAPSWGWVVAANVALGVNQGLAWSATVIMKIDLAGPARRGLAMGLNELAGYVAVAVVAWGTGLLAAAYGPRPVPFLVGVGIAVTGLTLSAAGTRETAGHAELEARGAGGDAGAGRGVLRELFETSFRDRTLNAACVAGLANNLNDGMAWGLIPIYLASRGVGVAGIGLIAGVYPAVWGVGQLATGAWSDRIGRKPLIVSGLLVQAGAIFAFAAAGTFASWLAAAAVMGAGTAMVYPTLLAAVADAAHPSRRSPALGTYRLWRDSGFAVGAITAGAVADVLGMSAAIIAVAGVTGAAGLYAWWRLQPAPRVTSAR